MGWIKRNLFFVIGGAVAVLLLGGAGYYIYASWSGNSDASVKLNEYYGTLQTLAQEHPAPGGDKVNNTTIAKEQEQQIREWIKSARASFQPIPAIPPTKPVTSEAYAAALRRTIDQLQREADGASVTLPPKYDFSFTAQRPLVKFAEGSLELLATQLGEVKAITETLYAARINALEGIQRVRVSDDDINGPQSDYLDEHPTTNDLAVITPYIVTFRCFSPELAHVLAGFSTSSNTFIVKALNVQPATGATALPGMNPEVQPETIPVAPGRTFGMMPGGYPVGVPAAAAPGATAQPAVGKGGLPTILKEQLLRITLEVELVKLQPKSQN